MAAPVNPLILDLRAAFGPAEPFFSATTPTPPAKLEYLVALNQLVLGAATTPYAGTGLNCNHNDAAGTFWFFAQRFAPATHAARVYVTRVVNFTSGAAGNATVRNTKTAPASGDRIDIPPTQGDGTESANMGNLARIDAGGAGYNASPTTGDNRLVEVDAQRAPVTEEFEAERVFGLGFVPRQSLDINAL